MKICIPTGDKEGKRSRVCGHFGSAPFFMIYDTDTDSYEAVENTDSHHSHGMCHPLRSLDGKKIGAVVCSGMGARAVQKLNVSGIKAFKIKGATAGEAVDNYRSGALEEITVLNACADHTCGNG
jgi:predicted Fe-Mo cluster-binding NifX family protein